ncbi:ABC transporter ATP-binding protein [Pseudodesulfovibrio sediminis]|uniref:ABC transporter ATP-binding protein n=1 Tax=Pseudodesulfovibrio sediminis TaxID=2810563 RepID=A0ABM8HWQ8_9BACT|nr:ABC transporter ATP-binding protein [Pseudodesulfovibrio sediminis]BCS88225.1 ABC transporter ATP-binding protein [Pseudodesulfovibrio sediminis]
MPLVQLQGISKSYTMGEVEIPALRDITLDIDKGNLVTFVGPSGSGKTTLLNIIGCMDKPTTGASYVDSTRTDTLNRKQAAQFRGEHLGFIFQSFNLIPVLSVFENVEYPLIMIKKQSVAARKEQVMRLLDAVGMTDQADKRPDQISGGQKQRVAVARALVTNPRMVLADEPTANLDKQTALNILKLMQDMRNEYGTTFIFSTHDPRIVEHADVIHGIEDGRLVDHTAFLEGGASNG